MLTQITQSWFAKLLSWLWITECSLKRMSLLISSATEDTATMSLINLILLNL